MASRDANEWPALPLEAWKDTYATLHMWMQIVGKVRLVQTPWLNHSWHVTLYVTGRGLTTSPIPYGQRTFQIDFDFVDHRLTIQCSDGATRGFGLRPYPVADFYAELFANLHALGLDVKIHTVPNEVPDPIPFEQDRQHASYDPEYANRFWRVLVQADRVFKSFRGRFIGKGSPVHFFWGSFDVAVTRFSGRPAPERPNADAITREAYSHEVISHGWWPGGGPIDEPAFYAYAAPEPAGFKTVRAEPAAAFYSHDFSEFILPYDAVRTAASPEAALYSFLRTTYDAGATLAGWDRQSLERPR
jgi:Family of unknown function (DUF5996)